MAKVSAFPLLSGHKSLRIFFSSSQFMMVFMIAQRFPFFKWNSASACQMVMVIPLKILGDCSK
ncbi:hypothetical protein BK127_25515 [Paenibacillus sp. FSL H7-0331]|nr:hypothetical protein BK127_25515 [Paenibacillus sp. FSL H7-0331]